MPTSKVEHHTSNNKNGEPKRVDAPEKVGQDNNKNYER